MLGELQEADTYVLQLIRDPRAVSYSMKRKRRQPGTEYYQLQHHPFRVSLRWSAWNLATLPIAKSASQHYFRLLYEDFIARPQITIRSILNFVGENAGQLPFLDDRAVKLTQNQGIWGNPNRSQIGKVELRRDDEWQSRMRLFDKCTVTAITWPLLLLYGYPIVRRAREKDPARESVKPLVTLR